MKKIAKTTVAITVILSLLVVAPVTKAKAQFSASISIQTFYDELAPYGQWIYDPDFGYVWIPDAGPGFRPYYSRGHWVMTGYGAMWISDYSWGWAPFHYGRWVFSSYYGDWVWVPDTEWGPAWVSWRWGGGYCGWAPLAPGISISLSFGSGYYVPNDWWVFVPAEHCLSSSFYNYRIAPERNITYIRNTSIINNTYVNNNITYIAGPGRNDIERVTHSKVPVYNIGDAKRPGKTSLQGNAVNVYRPQVTKSFKPNSKPVPHVVITRDQYRKNNTSIEPGKQNNQPSRTMEKKPVEQQNIPGRNKQIDQPSRTIEKKPVQQQNLPGRNKQIDQPSRTIEKKPVQQQNLPGRNKQIDQPSRTIERKQVEPQNIPERNNNKPVDQPSRSIERKQVQPQYIPQRNNNPVNQSPQQIPNQSRPANNKGNGKKGNN